MAQVVQGPATGGLLERYERGVVAVANAAGVRTEAGRAGVAFRRAHGEEERAAGAHAEVAGGQAAAVIKLQ